MKVKFLYISNRDKTCRGCKIKISKIKLKLFKDVIQNN